MLVRSLTKGMNISKELNNNSIHKNITITIIIVINSYVTILFLYFNLFKFINQIHSNFPIAFCIVL